MEIYLDISVELQTLRRVIVVLSKWNDTLGYELRFDKLIGNKIGSIARYLSGYL